MNEHELFHFDRPPLIRRRIGFYVLIAALLLAPLWASARAQGSVTWYVRPDGGSPDQCTGRVDASRSAPGSGTAQPCAWDHPFRALPPGGSPRMSGGDTLIIATGNYTMGYGAPGADNCEAGGAWDCYMPPIPTGLNSASPTRILGSGWDAGCVKPPQLWGTERANYVLNLTLAHSGVWAGRLTDWTVENVRIAGNGWVGWDGDIDGDDSNAGTLLFRRWTVEWNGCGETYPGQQPTGCWGQEAGGYGDGYADCDIGAYEWWQPTAWVYLPLVLKNP